MSSECLIYSLEHSGWWKQSRFGYTKVISEAGRFSYREAYQICMQANIVQNWKGIPPNEVMVPADRSLPPLEPTTIIKTIEIRDEGTCIAAMAIKMQSRSPIQTTFLNREGYPPDGSSITLMILSTQRATNDPYEWHSLGSSPRTMGNAHIYIIDHFDEIEDGDVLDVRVILGEATKAAKAEIWKGDSP